MKKHGNEVKQASQPAPTSGTSRSEREHTVTAGERTIPGDAPSGLPVDPARWDVLPDPEIASRAYEIWRAGGCRGGTDQEDWFEAERQLRMERGGKHATTHGDMAVQAREINESRQTREAEASIRDRMVAIGRGNQQAGRQGS